MKVLTDRPIGPNVRSLSPITAKEAKPMNAATSALSSRKADLPQANFDLSLEPGGVKKIKSENRRSDAMLFIDPAELFVIPGYNVRVRDAEYLQWVRDIADNMKAEGFNIDKPIAVVAMKHPVDGTDVLGVRNGHTRLEAALLAVSEGATIEVVPVVINPKTVGVTDMTVDLVRSNNGRPLTTYETSIVVKRLANMELTEAQIARKLDFAPSYVNGLMLLAAAPNPIIKMVVTRQVAAALAIEMIRKHGANKATELLRKAAEQASATGKERVTAAQLPDRKYTRAMQKAAPRLLERAQLIQRDPGFMHLSEDNQAAIAELLSEIEALKPIEGHE